MMTIRKQLIFFVPIVLIVLVVGFRSEAREWSIVGPRALGMGGANVAVANDATADYWNPAAFGFFKDSEGGDYGKRKWSWDVNVGAGAQIHDDIGQEINAIEKYNFGDIQTAINNNNANLTGAQVTNFIQLVNELKVFGSDSNRAATVLVNGGLRVQVGHFGIGGYLFSDISAVGSLDLTNIAPTNTATIIAGFNGSSTTFGPTTCSGNTVLTPTEITSLTNTVAALNGWASNASNFVSAANCALYAAQSSGTALPPNSTIITDLTTTAQLASLASTGGPISSNTSSLIFRGITVTEVPLTYGRSLTPDFAIGGNLKFMQGKAYQVSVPVFDKKFNDQLSAAKDNPNSYKDSQNFGLDLGMLYRFGDKLRFGMVGRNLNGPSFAMPSLTTGGPDDSIRELPQVRAGVAYKPLSFLMLAADMDLTRNDSTIPGGDYKYQNLAGGLELNVLRFLSIRGGLYKNLAESDIGPVYTAGLGFNFWLMNLDIGAAMGSKSSQLDSSSVPNEVRGEFALSMLF